MKIISRIFIVLGLVCFPKPTFAEDRISYIRYYHDTPYYEKLLKLALVKSRDRYGPYKLSITNEMIIDRALNRLSMHEVPNSVRMLLPQPKVNSTKNIAPIPFPITLGIFGYRVCFHSDSIKDDLAAVEDISQLNKYNYLLGKGWVDVRILRDNGFKVEEIGLDEIGLQRSIKTIYQRLDSDQQNLFCRSVGEVLSEKKYYNKIESIYLNKTIAIYYPLPFFYYTNVNDSRIAERIYYGLQKAYADGSMIILWDEFVGESVRNSNISNRNIFRLNNPFLDEIDPSFNSYIYQP